MCMCYPGLFSKYPHVEPRYLELHLKHLYSYIASESKEHRILSLNVKQDGILEVAIKIIHNSPDG